MEDVQSRKDGRNQAIDKVGVSDLRYPIVILDRANGKQHTVATVSLSVDLPHEFKGTHMSRFLETLTRHHGEITFRTLPIILEELRIRLAAENAHIELAFPYFIERCAPATASKALMDIDCQFVAESSKDKGDFVLQARIPVTSLCPCSKAISEYGAHNQRGYVTIALRTVNETQNLPSMFWIEELVEIVDQSGSSPIYPLLKREDERHVTMRAYENPVFVEDIVRNVALQLREDPRVAWFRVHALNHESIHNHSAFAEITWART